MSESDIVIEAFTELAPSYQETVDQELRQFWGVSYEEFIERLIKVACVGEDDVVLDVATGTAFIPLKLVDEIGGRGRVVGLDITAAMLEHGQRIVAAAGCSSRVDLVCASAMAMPFVGGLYDTAICALATHHMDVPQLVAEMKRALKTGGQLVMADVGATAFWRSFWGMALLKSLVFFYKLTHWSSTRAQAEADAFSNVRTADEWRALLAGLGFTSIEITETRARRRWYPSGLIIRAVAGSA